MKKLFIILCMCLCLVIVGCKKTVRITDTKTGTTYIVDENGASVEGTLPLSNGVSVTVTEETDAE